MKQIIKANLKLQLIGMYQREGISGVRNYLKRTGRECYLKRHHIYKATLEGAEILCKEILKPKTTY